MFSRSRGNLSDMKTHSFIWFTDLFKHQNVKIDKKKKKKKKIPAGGEDFFEAVLAMQKCFW